MYDANGPWQGSSASLLTDSPLMNLYLKPGDILAILPRRYLCELKYDYSKTSIIIPPLGLKQHYGAEIECGTRKPVCEDMVSISKWS